MELFFTGKTVEDAEQAALTKLGIAREDISMEVVEMPVRKLFGSKPAKIRVTLLAEEAAKEEAAANVTEPAKTAEPAKAATPAAKPTQAKPPKQSTDVSVPVEKAPAQPAADDVIDEKPAPTPVRDLNPEKVSLAKEYLEVVATDMGVEGFTVTPLQQEDTLILKIDGENLGMLIGRRGETMEALSYLAGLVANRLGGDYQKVALDVAGYRSKRENDLIALAKRIGIKVNKSGRSYTMEPMNPYERRIIHSTISKMENVTSESVGEGSGRRVVISCTGPNAIKGAPRAPRVNGPRQGGPRSGGRPRQGGPRSGGRPDGGSRRFNDNSRGGENRFNNAPHTEYKERSREQTQAPVVGERAETVNDAPTVNLYGKIEL